MSIEFKKYKKNIKTIARAEKELSEKAKQAALNYLETIESIVTERLSMQIDILPNGTKVYDKNGEIVGKIERSEWNIANSNQYAMPIEFKLVYYIPDFTSQTGISCYASDTVYTKDDVIKLLKNNIKSLESKISKIRKK